ncbi:MAG: threonine synthase, partial [Rubrivivax sp.]
MRYLSTRGHASGQRFCDILLEGLAPDGGLYVPEAYPKADLEAWRGLDYADLAFEVLRLFADDIPEADLRRLARNAYTKAAFGSDAIVPLKTLE